MALDLLPTLDRVLGKDSKEFSNNEISQKEIEESLRQGAFEDEHFLFGILIELEEKTPALVTSFEKNFCQLYKDALKIKDSPLSNEAARKNNYILRTFEKLANNQTTNKSLWTEFARQDNTEKYGEATETVKTTKLALRNAGYFPKGNIDGFATHDFNESIKQFKEDRDTKIRNTKAFDPGNQQANKNLYGTDANFSFKKPYKAAITQDFQRILALYSNKLSDPQNPRNHYQRTDPNAPKTNIPLQGPGSYAEQRREQLSNSGLEPGEDSRFERFSKEWQEANILSFTQDWRFGMGSYQEKCDLINTWKERILKIDNGTTEQKNNFIGLLLRRITVTRENKPTIFAIKDRAMKKKQGLPAIQDKLYYETQHYVDNGAEEDRYGPSDTPKVREDLGASLGVRKGLIQDAEAQLDKILHLPDNEGEGSYLTGIQDADLVDFIPFISRIHNISERRRREEVAGKGEKTDEDKLFLESFYSLDTIRDFDFSIRHDLGTLTPQLTTIAGEMRITGGIATEIGLIGEGTHIAIKAAAYTTMNVFQIIDNVSKEQERINLIINDNGEIDFSKVSYDKNRKSALTIGIFKSYGENLIGGIAKNLSNPARARLQKSKIHTETIEKYLCQGALQSYIQRLIDKTPLKGKALQNFITNAIADLTPKKIIEDNMEDIMKTSFTTLVGMMAPSGEKKETSPENAGFLSISFASLFKDASKRILPKDFGKVTSKIVEKTAKDVGNVVDNNNITLTATNTETQQEKSIVIPSSLLASFDLATSTPESIPKMLEKYGIKRDSDAGNIVVAHWLSQTLPSS